MGDSAELKAVKLAKQLRDDGFWAEYDVMGRGLKAQMKYADKIGAEYVIVLGDNEINTGDAKLKNMKTGEQLDIKFDEKFIDNFANIQMADMFGDILN